MAFTSLPGQVFSGKLVQVMPTIAEAQLAAGQALVGGAAFQKMDNEALVIIELEGNDEVQSLPMGVSAQAAVYTEHLHHVAIIRRILLRMMSWRHYLYLDH